MRRHPSLAAVALLLAASSCLAAPESGPASTAARPSTNVTTTPDTSTSAPEAATTAPPGEFTEAVRELQEATERVRGLEFLEDPLVTIATREELAQRVREQIAEDLPLEEVQVDEALLKLLGLLEPDVDLLALYQDLYAEQVAGFYDGETGEMVVGAEAEFSALNRITLVHELVHAVTDQHFGFHDVLRGLDDEQRYDEASALQALVEGDATFHQFVYLQQEMSREDQMAAVLESFQQDTGIFDAAPTFIQLLLRFPYETGNAFVEQVAGDGGVEAVNAAYGNSPVSTEQVIHPSSYLAGEEPAPVELSLGEVDGYEVAEESVWGELGFRVMLEDGLGSDAARAPSEGWGGDRYQILWSGVEVALVLEFLGDADSDAVELEEAMASYAEEAMSVGDEESLGVGRRWQGEDYFYQSRSGDRLSLVAASDPATGSRLVTAIEG